MPRKRRTAKIKNEPRFATQENAKYVQLFRINACRLVRAKQQYSCLLFTCFLCYVVYVVFQVKYTHINYISGRENVNRPADAK